jgi:hypothetical protein
VNKNLGQLFRIEIKSDGTAGAVTMIKTSQPLKGPDGLKVIDASTLWAAQGAGDGMDIITLAGDTAQVRSISAGLDGVATFAYYKGSAWVVENQGNHFWDPTNAGAEATKPFLIVEVPVN